VFAHFLLPHPPYLFDRNGRILRHATVANQLEIQNQLWDDREAYVEQLQFVGARVLEAIKRIQATSRREPIIILMSDHGPTLPGEPRDAGVQGRFANLLAVDLPDADAAAAAALFPDDVVLVNVFRALLSRYFGTDLPPLPARHFVSFSRDPFAFEDVTDVLW
jgi:hypothetical protein